MSQLDSCRFCAKNAVVLFLILISGAVLFSGCGATPQDENTAREARSRGIDIDPAEIEPAFGDWLMIHMPSEMPHLNPLTSSDAYASTIMGHIFDSLLDRDPETLEMTPHVAESWEISEDNLQYTFTLREGIQFSDGEPLTVEDVLFTYEMIMSPEVDAPHLRSYFVDIIDCEILDEYTVRFTCDKPYYRHIVMLGGMSILPKHIYGEGDFNNHPNNRRPIGSGPYILESWDTGRQVVLARNDLYWGEIVDTFPYFDKKVYQIITDPNAAFQVQLRGDLDVMNHRAEDWIRRANTARFEDMFNKFEYYAPSYGYIGWNSRRPLFEDKRVRTAMTMLLDRESIREHIYHGLARTVSGNFMIGTPEHNDNIEPLPFDPEAAVALLEEAGWVDSTGDGIRDKDGVSMRFDILLPNNSPEGERICTLFKEELGRVGIQLNIRQMEWASMTDRVQARNFDAYMMGWSMPPDPDPYQVWHSSQADSGSNYVGFIHEEADRLVEDARISFDRDERIRMYHRFHEILHEEQPYTFLFSRMTLLAVDKRIHGIHIYPFGPDQMEWFVPEGIQKYIR